MSFTTSDGFSQSEKVNFTFKAIQGIPSTKDSLEYYQEFLIPFGGTIDDYFRARQKVFTIVDRDTGDIQEGQLYNQDIPSPSPNTVQIYAGSGDSGNISAQDPAYDYLDDLEKIYRGTGNYSYIRRYENLRLRPVFNTTGGVSSPSYYHPLLKDVVPFNIDPTGGYDVIVKRTADSSIVVQGSPPFIVDSGAGTLTFYDEDPDGLITNSNPPTVTFYRYEGNVGVLASNGTSGGVGNDSLWYQGTGDFIHYPETTGGTGQVVIGSDTPREGNYKLDVHGTMFANVVVTNRLIVTKDPNLIVTIGESLNNSAPQLESGDSSSGADSLWIRNDDLSNDNNQIIFFTSTTAENTQVVIGNSAPRGNFALDVFGNVSANGVFTSTMDVSGDLTADTVEARNQVFLSDARLKMNIQEFKDDDLMDKINNLNCFKYNWKTDNRPDIGFIAQEMESVFPELVIENDKGFKAIKYIQFICVLMECIKSQQKEINAHKQDLKKLFTKIEKLENLIEKIIEDK